MSWNPNWVNSFTKNFDISTTFGLSCSSEETEGMAMALDNRSINCGFNSSMVLKSGSIGNLSYFSDMAQLVLL